MDSKELTNGAGVTLEADPLKKNSVSQLEFDCNPVIANGQSEPGSQLSACNIKMAINGKCHIDVPSVDGIVNCSNGDAPPLISQPDEEADVSSENLVAGVGLDSIVDTIASAIVSDLIGRSSAETTLDCGVSNGSASIANDDIREHVGQIVDKIVTDHMSQPLHNNSTNVGDCNLAFAELNINSVMHDTLDDYIDDRTDSSVELDSDQSANSSASKSSGCNKRKKRNSRKKSSSTPVSEINVIDNKKDNPGLKTVCDNSKPNGQIEITKPKVIATTDLCKSKPIDSSTSAKLNKSNTSDDKRLKTSKSELKGKLTVDSSKQPKTNNSNGILIGSSPEIVLDRTSKPDNASSVKCNEVDSSKTITEEKTIATTEASPAEASVDRATSDTTQSNSSHSFDEPNQLNRKLSSASSLASQSLSDHSSMEDSHAESKLKPNGKSFGTANPNGESLCKICNKHVYHMEQIKAVKSVFHRSCFRCAECSKQLNVDSYSSHEGIIYCKPHFKQLFQPKAVFDNDDSKQKLRRKNELIICENTPKELPPDVVRSNLKLEDPLENLNLDLSNIRNRFEKGNDRNEPNTEPTKKSTDKTITRSESIHKIMQKYQSRVAGDKDLSSSDEEDYIKPENEVKEEKVAFGGMSALKSQWESGSITANNKGDNIVENELAELRQKGKSSEPLKQAYERAIQEAKSFENLTTKSESVVSLDSPIKAVSIKEKFEKGNLETESEEDRIERLKKEREEELVRIAQSEANTKEARNKFKQIEANMGKEQITTSNGQVEDVSISANELQQRFKYFENLQENQPNNAKENSKDEIDSNVDDIPKVDTAKKMLNKFKALEAGQINGEANGLPKSPKRITPPRETPMVYENEPIADRDPNIVKSSYKTEDVIGVEPEKAKNLRAKFENWQTEIERENRKNNYDEEDEFVPHIDTTKNLRAMFESIKDEYKPSDKPRPRINRFVNESKTLTTETCYVCSSRLYPMEKMEFSGIKLHKNCFRCNKCHTPLRLDNFTIRAEKLFCIPHFKQMFMEKGNYDEGFGLEQHKDKWSNKAVNGKANGIESTNGNGAIAPVSSNGTNGNGNVNDHKPDDEPLSHDEEESIEYDDQFVNNYSINDSIPVGDM